MNIEELIAELRRKGFEPFISVAPYLSEPFCPFCGAKEYHLSGWCVEHQRIECIAQHNKELENENAQDNKKSNEQI